VTQTALPGTGTPLDPTPDVLGEPYEAITVDFPADDEGPVVATVVRRTDRSNSRAVLFVHGLNDYFFQTELADRMVEQGFDFYAVDLRKCGRSLRPGQTPHYTTDLAGYVPDLEAALAVVVLDGHEAVTVMAHSTGGLTVALWLAARQRGPQGLGPVTSLVLNSPLLELPASWAVRTALSRPAELLATRNPMATIPLTVSELYGRSIHRSGRGEWDYDLELKTLAGQPTRAGWLAAVVRGLRAAHAGLDLAVPVLVLCSARSIVAKVDSDDLFTADVVLDADATARWSTRLGRCVTCLRITDGMHDLVLSRPPVRAAVYAELRRWLGAYAVAPPEPAAPLGPLETEFAPAPPSSPAAG
jgi:alpha-beta hydrolase superfamily lysophospholipase